MTLRGISRTFNLENFTEEYFQIVSNLNHLQVNIKQSSDQDPQFEIVEAPKSSNKSNECFKVQRPLLVVSGAVQARPGDDGEGGGACSTAR